MDDYDFIPNCVVRQHFNRNPNYYHHQQNRYQPAHYHNPDVHYTPQLRWVPDPYNSQNASLNRSRDVNHPRRHSDEPVAISHATSSTASRRTAAENAQPSDSLTNKLTERTSMIINNVLSGKDGADAKKRDRTTAFQLDRSSAGHTANTSRAGSSGQSKQLSSDKPKNAAGNLEKPLGASTQKGSTSSGHINAESLPMASKMQPGKASTPSRSDVLLSPNSSASRTGHDIQASLVRMATAPRSRREQLELERMIQEHAKKSVAAKEHLSNPQSSSSGISTVSDANNSQNILQPNAAGVGFPTEATKSNSDNSVIIIGEERGSSGVANVKESRPASSSTSSITGTKKSAKKTCTNNNKPKTARVPKAKTRATKTAKAKTNKKKQAAKKNSKLQKFRNLCSRQQRRANPSQFRAANNSTVMGKAVQLFPSQLPSLVNLDTGLGTSGLSANLVPGFVGGSQHMMTSPPNRATSSLLPTPTSSQAADRGPLNTLLQMSLHEENLCGKLSQCNSDIGQLQSAIAKLDEQLQKRIELRTNVSFICFLFSHL